MFILALCDVEEVQEIFSILKVIVEFIRIVVPIILIVSAMITLMQDIKAGDSDALAKSKKVLINKVIASIIIIFVPLFVELVFKVAGAETDYKKCFDIQTGTSGGGGGSSETPGGNGRTDEISMYMNSASNNLSRSDYNKAYDKVSKIEDEELKNKYLEELDSIDKLISKYESSNNRTTNRTTKKTTSPASKTVAGSYYLGDSRTVGMSSILDKDEKAIAKNGANYTNFITDASTLKNNLYGKSDSYNVVLNYGVNDLYNVSKYCDGYKELASDLGNNYTIYVVSVNPVDDSKDYNAKNKDINEFNSSIKSCISSVSNMKYCDVSSKATSSAWSSYLSDGLHYNSDGYKFIHSEIKECMK